MNSSLSSNNALTDSENIQSKPVQSHNLDIVPVSACIQGLPNSKMEIENIFHIMLKQVGTIGEMCRNNFLEAGSRLAVLEDKSNLVNAALETLVNKDEEITSMLKCQANFNEFASQALNWLRRSSDLQQQTLNAEKMRSLEWEQRTNEDIRASQKFSKEAIARTEDLRNFSFKAQLLEDQVHKLDKITETHEACINTLKFQSNTFQTRISANENSSKQMELKLIKMEDQILLLEERLKEARRTTEEIPKVRDDIKSNMRDTLILEEDVEKLKGTLHNLEDKIEKCKGKKLSQSEKSAMNSLEIETTSLQERVRSIEFTVEHLNDVKFEDFSKRFKKEVIESSDNQMSKLVKRLKELEEKNEQQKIASEALQKNMSDLRKKLEVEHGKIQDLLNIKNDSEKWKINDLKLDDAISSIEDVYLKLKQFDSELLNIQSNVFDFSFKRWLPISKIE